MNRVRKRKYKKIKGQNCRKAVTQSHGSQGRDSRAADSDGQEYSVRLLSLRKTISLGIVFFGPERGRRIKIENEKVMRLASCIRYAPADTGDYCICRYSGAGCGVF